MDYFLVTNSVMKIKHRALCREKVKLDLKKNKKKKQAFGTLHILSLCAHRFSQNRGVYLCEVFRPHSKFYKSEDMHRLFSVSLG